LFLYISGWDLNGDGTWDANDVFTGADWEAVLDILDDFTGLRSLEISQFYIGDTDFARLFDTGEVLNSCAGTLGSLFCAENELTSSSLSNITSLTALEYLALDSMTGITDITDLTPMTTLEVLLLSGTGISDITPLETLYDNGSFRNHLDYRTIDIELYQCPNLELTIQSGNRQVLDYLIDNGVRVGYDDNTLELAGTWYWWLGMDNQQAYLMYSEFLSDQYTHYVMEDGSIFDQDQIPEWDNTENTIITGSSGNYRKISWVQRSADTYEFNIYAGTSDIDSARSNTTIEDTVPFYRDISTIPAVLKLNGEDPVAIATGDTFIDPGATAWDWDETGGTTVIVDTTVQADTSSLDTSTAGTYTSTYTYTDADGNESEPLTRTVIVGGGIIDVTIQ
jgi:hypothetical protein